MASVTRSHAEHVGASFAALCTLLAERAAETHALAGYRHEAATEAGNGTVTGKRKSKDKGGAHSVAPDALNELATRISEAESAFDGLTAYVDSEERDLAALRGAVDSAQAQAEHAKALTAHAKHVTKMVPDVRQPSLVDATNAGPASAPRSGAPARSIKAARPAEASPRVDYDAGSSPDGEAADGGLPPSRSVQRRRSARKSVGSTRKRRSDASDSGPSTGAGAGSGSGSDGCPSVRHLTEAEFKAIPSYMVGRMKLAALNTAVDEINGVLKAKYKLLQTPIARLRNPKTRSRAIEFREQEGADTDGTFFVTTNDITECPSITGAGSTKSILSSLRHVGLLKQTAAKGGVTRLTVVVAE